jgi:hypothetical protein
VYVSLCRALSVIVSLNIFRFTIQYSAHYKAKIQLRSCEIPPLTAGWFAGRDAGEQREGGAPGTRPRQAQGQGEGRLPRSHGQYSYCKDTIPKIRNKYSQKRKLGGLSPSQSYIHVSMGDLYIPTMGLPILLQENRFTDPGNIHRSLTNT